MSDVIRALAYGGEGVLIPWVLLDALEGNWVAAAALKRVIWWWTTWEGIDRDGEHWVAVSRAEFSADLRISEDQARRVMQVLVEQGFLIKGGRWVFRGAPTSHYRPNPARLDPCFGGTAPMLWGSVPNALGVQPQSYTEQSPKEASRKKNPPGAKAPAPPAPAVPSAKGRAKALLDAWWITQNPRPAQPFIACLNVLTKLLEAGWSDDELQTAMDEVLTFSIKSFEVVLNRRRGRGNGNGNGHASTASVALSMIRELNEAE